MAGYHSLSPAAYDRLLRVAVVLGINSQNVNRKCIYTQQLHDLHLNALKYQSEE